MGRGISESGDWFLQGAHCASGLAVSGLLGALVACGRLAGVPEASETALDASTPLVTLEVAERPGSGLLLAHDLRAAPVATTALDVATNAYEPHRPVWSATGRWLMYMADAPADTHLWLRRYDADSTATPWREPVLANGDAWKNVAYGNYAPSPTRDQFLLWKETGATGTPFAVVTPHDDGTVAVRELHRLVGTSDPDVPPYQHVDARWTPTGDRIVMAVREPAWPLRVVVFDVGLGEAVEPSGPSRELAVEGLGDVSQDGVWMQSSFRPVPDGGSYMVVVSLVDGASRDVPGCGLDRPNGIQCFFGPWHPSRTAMLVLRGTKDARQLVLWSPKDGELASIPMGDVPSWVGVRHPRVLMRADRRSRRLSLVDFEGSAPVATEIAGTERATFTKAEPSPDGRWLLLEHIEQDTHWFEALDLDGDPSATPREVYRNLATEPSFAAKSWGPPGSSTLLFREVPTSSKHDGVKRAIFVDLPTGTHTLLEVTLATPPDPLRTPWSWASRISPDGKSVVIARDGKLGLWRKGAPTTDLLPLGDTSEWALPFWPPSATWH